MPIIDKLKNIKIVPTHDFIITINAERYVINSNNKLPIDAILSDTEMVSKSDRKIIQFLLDAIHIIEPAIIDVYTNDVIDHKTACNLSSVLLPDSITQSDLNDLDNALVFNKIPTETAMCMLECGFRWLDIAMQLMPIMRLIKSRIDNGEISKNIVVGYGDIHFTITTYRDLPVTEEICNKDLKSVSRVVYKILEVILDIEDRYEQLIQSLCVMGAIDKDTLKKYYSTLMDRSQYGSMKFTVDRILCARIDAMDIHKLMRNAGRFIDILVQFSENIKREYHF